MGKRLNLKQFRIALDLTQSDFAAGMGVKRSQYQMIESGIRNGGFEFWQRLQKSYNVPAGEMWELMQITSEGALYGKTKIWNYFS